MLKGFSCTGHVEGLWSDHQPHLGRESRASLQLGSRRGTSPPRALHSPRRQRVSSTYRRCRNFYRRRSFGGLALSGPRGSHVPYLESVKPWLCEDGYKRGKEALSESKWWKQCFKLWPLSGYAWKWMSGPSEGVSPERSVLLLLLLLTLISIDTDVFWRWWLAFWNFLRTFAEAWSTMHLMNFSWCSFWGEVCQALQ